MTTTVGSKTGDDLAEEWLNTGGIPVLGNDGAKRYPRRSDLRRAEARATSRPTPRNRPADNRPAAPSPARQRPGVSAPPSARAVRRPTRQAQFPLQSPYSSQAPSAAVLPIPRTAPGRPAGIDMPVPRATPADAFRRAVPQPPTAPIEVPAEWGLDLDDSPATAEPASKWRFGRLNTAATRLLVMALVVGAEGAAVSQLATLNNADSSSASSAFALTSAHDDSEADSEAEAQAAAQAAAQAEAEQAEVSAATLKSIKDASPAKASAALAQSEKGAKALAEKKRKEKAAAEKAKKEAAEKEAARLEAAKAEEAEATSTRQKALALENARKNPQAAAKILLADRGWSSAQYTCLDSLWTRESTWNYQATNPSSGAYGIPQALPGSKMASAGSDWKTNPVTQIRWGLDYIAERYGTPCGAWSHSESVGWY
ncbi:hypothetical protein KIH74_28035 [Kineosporia sp. J2-2]|uniref:Lytic transglycosylase domain-containing protein n=1 Tax=Kineosporia corallincola TaxID=2835133 RepID=A0ABS5TR78_9ACTN|nr:hypothetical protein [Kineosporia corallincola]MBT0772824.1 hypothetical protein [Kineosporia corallincola]